ncbi:CsgG/HfaB family protein [Bordetella sp. LUAb4]|uniref:CsgG/HfaB family protein n=1 Tax=Bordetella sp. LUAb4 TaxID=2843195 RepID=UPI001E64D025|nr:CsgG/HfaB family protein [Bordetella sp. LUAb4]
MLVRSVLTVTVLTLAACATVSKPPVVQEAPASRAAQAQAQEDAAVPAAPVLKRKIAIGRFSNETRYGRTFQTDNANDPLGKQVSDMLATRLTDSQRFLVFERSDLNKVLAEQRISGDSGLIGVDTLIIGSLTEFGRSTTGKRGFLSGTKIQTAQAKVEARLVDVRTGQVFFSTTGSGSANTESGEIAGFGSKAGYDGTLNDKAIAAAISDLMGRLMDKLQERPWRTDILKVAGKDLYIAGGARQGLKVGDVLTVFQSGSKVKSAQNGFNIDLPPTQVGTARVISLFGDSDTNEGAVVRLQAGSVAPTAIKNTFLSKSEH